MQLTDKNGNVYGWNGLEITGPDGKPKTIDQGLTSVGLSMPSAFTVSNSPLTSNGTIGVTGAGTNLEYIDGTGALRTFPSLSGYVTAVTASLPLSSSGGTTPNITISQASGTDDGYLSSTDWLTFNSKQPAGNYITALSGEASGSGPGTASVTLNNASVTAKVLTGVNITGGSISASDSILTAFGKLQNQINGLIGSAVYQGTWNASTNNPTLTSGVGTRGYYYIVNVAGSTNLDGITDWNVGDWAIFDGTAWQQVDNTDSVTSVNGQTGAVSLTTDNIPEGAVNQYFTQLRARQSLTLSTIGSSGAATYDNTTGILNIPIYTDQYVGTVTSVDMSVPTGFTISGNPITSAGTLILGFNSDYSLPTIASQLEWDQAYDDMIVSASVTGTTTKTLTLNQQDGGTITASWTDYDTAPVTSVFGRTGDVVAQSGDYTTTLVFEGTNLYYTDARSRAAISSSATGLTYSSGSGVFSLTAGYSIPTTANQSNWTTAYNRSIVSAAVTYGANTNLVLTQQNTGTITASLVAGTASQGKFVFFNGTNLAYTSLNASAPLSFDTNTYTFSISQASGSTNGYLSSTDWNTFNNKQNAITLTTTGTSGPATLIGSTLNIPQYQEIITNPVTGTGTANYVARWTSSSQISTGVLYDNGTNVGIGTNNPASKLTLQASNNTYALELRNSLGDTRGGFFYDNTSGTNTSLFMQSSIGTDVVVLRTSGTSYLNGGNVGIGTTSPSAKLHVNGTFISNALWTDNTSVGYWGAYSTAYGYLTWDAGFARIGAMPGNRLDFSTNGSTLAMTIATDGNIGIGTTGPNSLLSATERVLLIENSNLASLYLSSLSGRKWSMSSAGDGALVWWDLNSVAERMRINSSGNVGINTSSPSQKLDVAGRARVDRFQYQQGIDISNLNLNDYTDAGFYIGSTMTNAPTTGWFYVTVERHSDNNWVHQTATTYGSGNTPNEVYTRVKAAGSWGAWKQLADSASISGTTNYVSKFTSSTTIGNSLIYDNGTNVGIGNTNPTQLVDIGATGAFKTLRVRGTYNFDGSYLASAGANGGAKLELVSHSDFSNSASYRIQHNRDATTALTFDFASPTTSYAGLSYVERMRIDVNGNVGIGTTNPLGPLEVYRSAPGSLGGYIVINNDGSSVFNETALMFGDGAANGIRAAISTTTEDNPYYGKINFKTGAGTYSSLSTRMTINGAGNVGIGTSSPARKLDVSGKAIFTNLGVTGTPYWNNNSIELQSSGGQTIALEFHRAGFSSATIFSDNGSIAINTDSGSERFRVAGGSGYVGINTSNPSSRLTLITGSGYTDSFNITDGVGTMQIGHWDTTHNRFEFVGKPTYFVQYGSSNYIAFGTQGDERMRIAPNSNVGIGTTNPTQKLEVSGNIKLSSTVGSTSTPSFIWLGNDFSNGNTRDKLKIYLYNSSTEQYGFTVGSAADIQYHSNGTHNFFIGNTFSTSINSTGIGIGTSTPSQSLHVNGNARVTGAYYDSNNQAGTSGQILSSTGSGTDWVDSPTSTATSVAQLLPSATVNYSWVGQVIDGTWVDIFTKANNVLTTGVWMVTMYVNDHPQGGNHYTYRYSGTMTWYQDGTNQTGLPAASEIALHRMGHAANNCILYLRTTEEAASDGGNGKLQINANYSNTSNTTITFTFVKII